MAVNAAVILVAGIIIYFLVYYLRVKKIDRDVMKCDPSRKTPANVYMDGVEYFPTNKFVLFGFQFKSHEPQEITLIQEGEKRGERSHDTGASGIKAEDRGDT